MRAKRLLVLAFAVLLCVVLVAGCGSKVDETKPLSDVKEEAKTMDEAQLRKMALAYKDAIMAKQKEIEALKTKLKEVPITEVLGEEAKALKADLEEIGSSLSSLKKRFQVYIDMLQDKKADLSGLELK